MSVDADDAIHNTWIYRPARWWQRKYRGGTLTYHRVAAYDEDLSDNLKGALTEAQIMAKTGKGDWTVEVFETGYRSQDVERFTIRFKDADQAIMFRLRWS